MCGVKLKKPLRADLPIAFKDRVYYTFAKYIYYDNCWDYVYPIFYIRVDKETWFSTNVNWLDKVVQCANRQSGRKYNNYWSIRQEDLDNAVNMATKEMGTLDMLGQDDYLMEMIHNYLNVYTIDECMNHENYFYRILAVLDKRTGKRKIKKLLENIDSEPEWFRKYIILRAEAQNINIG